MADQSKANGVSPIEAGGCRTLQGLEKILNNVPHVLWSSSPDGRPDFLSEQWLETYGGDPDDLLGDGWIGFVHPDDKDRAVANWQTAMETGDPYESEFRIRLPDGSYRWALVTAKAERDASGAITRWFGSCTDIHDRVLAQDALKSSEGLYRSVMEASVDCIKILSRCGRLELMNRPGLAAMDIGRIEDIRGRHWHELWPDEMRATVADAIARAVSGEKVRFRGLCPSASGVPRWWDVVVTPITDGEGEVRSLLAISRDVSAEREKSQQLLWASEHDALTGLPNRRAFQDRLQAAIARSREAASKLGLLLIDLDHFKHVNDTLGHPAGDMMLKSYARRLRTAVRSGDFVARIGGDEFAVVLEDVDCAETLLRVGDSICRRLKSPLRIEGRAVSGGASIGCALYPDDATNADVLFRLADTAVYSLKSDGRGGTKLFELHMREAAQTSASQLSLARMAVTDKTVMPFYQPKTNLHTGAVEGLEALFRWNHPREGLQLPQSIEEAFKDYELATKIGELMQRKTLADMQQWLTRGIPLGRVSVNASPAEFLRDDYAERLLNLLRHYRVPPSSLEIEVTEHVLMDRGSRYVARALGHLKQAGVTISLDDFGTGYSSLSHLRDFPVDVVKIDKSFVQKVDCDAEIAAIVTAVINLGNSLGIETVAEGVESARQAELLRAAGCRLGQGYLFGHPMEADAVPALLGTRAAA